MALASPLAYEQQGQHQAAQRASRSPQSDHSGSAASVSSSLSSGWGLGGKHISRNLRPVQRQAGMYVGTLDEDAARRGRLGDKQGAYPWSNPGEFDRDASELMIGGLTGGANTRLPTLRRGPNDSARYRPLRDPGGSLTDADLLHLAAFVLRIEASTSEYDAESSGGLYHLIQSGDQDTIGAYLEFRFHNSDNIFLQRLEQLQVMFKQSAFRQV